MIKKFVVCFQLIYPVQGEHKDYPPLTDFSNEYLEVLQQVQVNKNRKGPKPGRFP